MPVDVVGDEAGHEEVGMVVAVLHAQREFLAGLAACLFEQFRLELFDEERIDEALVDEPASRVTWTLTEAGDGLVLLRVVHDGLDDSPLTSASVGSGWPYVLAGLKSLVETGAPLPPRYPAPAGR